MSQNVPTQATAESQPAPEKDMGTALVLEILGGIFQIFGIGHFYAGNPLIGIFVMIGYWMWLIVGVLIAVVTLGIGLLLLPVFWLLFIVISPIGVWMQVKRANKKTVVYMVQG